MMCNMASMKVDLSSRIGPQPAETSTRQPIDRLSVLLERFRVRAALFHNGPLCGRARFEARPGRAFLHVLRQGQLTVRHRSTPGVRPVLELREPSALLYARPIFHEFIHPPREGSDFSCATLDFDGAEHNPIVHALPPLICVPLARIEGLQPALDLLFAETDRVRCGSRVLIDRLFEVVFIQLLRWILDHPDEVGVSSGMIAGLSDTRLARALVAMHGSPARAWSLAALATEAAMSRSAFAQAFKCATGVTPARYLTDWRLTLATTLLHDGRPLKQVAEEVGFAGPSSLSRAFKQRFGACPREWASKGSTAASSRG
jgi:AraC-like DNA-binding protein